jgi:hypothetical protein
VHAGCVRACVLLAAPVSDEETALRADVELPGRAQIDLGIRLHQLLMTGEERGVEEGREGRFRPVGYLIKARVADQSGLQSQRSQAVEDREYRRGDLKQGRAEPDRPTLHSREDALHWNRGVDRMSDLADGLDRVCLGAERVVGRFLHDLLIPDLLGDTQHVGCGGLGRRVAHVDQGMEQIEDHRVKRGGCVGGLFRRQLKPPPVEHHPGPRCVTEPESSDEVLAHTRAAGQCREIVPSVPAI